MAVAVVFVVIVASKGRYFGLLLYPDSNSYNCDDVLYDCMGYFNECSYILHDADVDDDGCIKKPHYHVICKKSSSVNLSTIVNRYSKMGVLGNFVYLISSYKQQLRYLIHLDDSEKYQYSFDNITSNVLDLNKYFNQLPEGMLVLNMVDMRLNGSTYRKIIEYSVKNGCYDVFRKNVGVINFVVQEEFGRRLQAVDFREIDIMDF